jgi:Predicted dehydrogenases and related proteins
VRHLPGQQSTFPLEKNALPRLGFLGVGWIGRNRLEVIAQSGLAEIAVICDTSPEILQQSLTLAPTAQIVNSYDELLSADIDGVIIATPSAQHAEQSLRALERGLPVFCQKPLGRNANETRSVVEAARKANRLLGIDLAYRFTMALQAIHSVISSGELGQIYAANLVFHNAYGPDKDWFYDRSRPAVAV